MVKRRRSTYRDNDQGANLERIAELEARLHAYEAAGSEDIDVRELTRERNVVVDLLNGRAAKHIAMFCIAFALVILFLGVMGWTPVLDHDEAKNFLLAKTMSVLIVSVAPMAWAAITLMAPANQKRLVEIDRQLVAARASHLREEEKRSGPDLGSPSRVRVETSSPQPESGNDDRIADDIEIEEAGRPQRQHRS